MATNPKVDILGCSQRLEILLLDLIIPSGTGSLSVDQINLSKGRTIMDKKTVFVVQHGHVN